MDHEPRSLYLLAGEYSTPEDSPTSGAAFVRAPRRPQEEGGPEPDLGDLLYRASMRALTSVGDSGIADQVTHLLVTTMPHGEDSAFDQAVNLPNRLKRRLGLAGRCQARFEIGTSDAGAAVFASAVHLLRGLPEEATALVTAGQTMWGGRLAIQTVARVLEADERAVGMNMIAVGDLLMERFVAGWRRDGVTADGAAPTDSDAAAMLDALVRRKLELALEYPAAMRSGADALPPDAPWISRWLKREHVAPASVGACAVLLTTDEALVTRWARVHGHDRVVRVLGVGEGDADTRVSRRREPFGTARSIRQAFHSLCRVTGTNLDFLRASSFAILHDAFPSIEMAFLGALGLDPRAAVQRSMSYWPNPYGGLTAFGHALGASGLVQVAKAFHVFTGSDVHLAPDQAGGSHHPDFSRTDGATHCLTTSVGGPLTHVVATLLQAVPVQRSAFGEELDAALASPWVRLRPPRLRRRHRYDADRDAMPPVITRWACEAAEVWRQALVAAGRERLEGQPLSLGVLVSRTSLDVRGVPHPLPPEFVETWRPAILRFGNEALPMPESFLDDLRQALKPDKEGDPAGPVRRLKALVSDRAEALLSVFGDGAPTGRAASAALWASLQVPMGLLTEGRADEAAGPRRLCLLAGPCDDGDAAPLGSVLVVFERSPVGVAVAVEHAPGLAPPWVLDAAGPPVDDPPLAGEQDAVAALVDKLLNGPLHLAEVTAAQRYARRLAGPLVARPDEPPPAAARVLLQELVWTVEPDRWRLADALAELAGLSGAERAPTTRTMAYVEFDIAGAAELDHRSYVEHLDAIVDGVRKAEGWLGGARLHFERLRDGMAVTAWDPRLEDDARALWPVVVRFARDVYQACLRRGFAVRVTCCIDQGSPVDQVQAREGGAGRFQLAAYRGMQGPALRGRRRTDPPDGSRRTDGIAVVVPRVGLDDVQAATVCDAIWTEAGGERLDVVDGGAMEVSGDRFVFQVRRRATLDARTPSVPSTPTRRS